MPVYKLFVPKQAVGANLVYFDLFVPVGSGVDVTLVSVRPVVSGEVAVVGVLGVDLFLTRTTAVGTGGTAATAEGTSLTAMTFSCLDGDQPIRTGQITARLTPSGGATAGAVLSWCSVFTEETTSGAYYSQTLVLNSPIKNGTGIRVVQGGVASVGNIGFSVVVSFKAR